MKSPEKKKLILVNLGFWIVATLAHPIAEILPTASGNPPKIFSLFIPLFFLMLAAGSTYLLTIAAGKSDE